MSKRKESPLTTLNDTLINLTKTNVKKVTFFVHKSSISMLLQLKDTAHMENEFSRC